jgi:hypothetical protein
VSKIELGFPHDFLQQFSSSSIVNHRAPHQNALQVPKD